MNQPFNWILGGGAILLLTLFSFFLLWFKGRTYLKKAHLHSEKVLADTKKELEEKKREIELDNKEKWMQAKLQFEQETETRRRELQSLEEK